MDLKKLIVFLCLALAAGAAHSEESDAPLAVTVLARPTLRSTPTRGAQEQSDEFLQTGLGFLKDGKPDRALQAFNDSVRLAPSADNYKALGTAYYQSGYNAKAAWAYRQSLALKSDPKVQALVDSLARPDSPEDQTDLSVAGRRLKEAADAAETDLQAGELAEAIEALLAAQPYRSTQGLDPAGQEALARLDKAEARAVRASGLDLPGNRKAMTENRAAWERRMREQTAQAKGL